MSAIMEAVRYNGANKPLTLESIPKPTPSSDQVLVKVEAAALCHTELHFADGTLDLGVKPMTLGHEAVGTIVAVGDSVTSSRIGERVIVYYYVGCGTCRWCRKGEEQICNSLQAEYGFISDGGLADYLAAPSRNAVVLPDTLSFIDAAPIGCGVTTAVHAAKLADVKEGEYALVYGCNGVGFGLVQLLKNELRVEKIIVVARSEAKRAKALELGADVAIDGTDPSTVAAAVREATNGEGADVIFECVGRRETMDACVGWAGALGKRGRLVMVGYHAGDEHEFRYHPVPMIVYEQQILGSVGATLEDLKQAVDLVGTGKVKTIVDCTLPLSRFQEGLDKIKSCECIGKVVCLPCTE
jgi:propanol-preferring alcohol dehydrogenase